MNDNGRINVANDKVFERDPVNLIRMFKLADDNDLDFHPDALHLLTKSLSLCDRELRANEEANRLFLDILTTRNGPENLLRRMNEAGLLGKFIPAFGKIVAMMQFNMYHHYTVDEHLLRSVGNAAPARKRRRWRRSIRWRATYCRRSRTGRFSMSPCSSTTSPRAAWRIIPSPVRASRANCARGSA